MSKFGQATNKSICSLDACEREVYAKNLCNRHWARVRRTGSLTPKYIYKDDAARFWSKVEKTDTCWLWRGSVQKDGYGVVGVGGKTLFAHRYSYELAGNKLTPDMQLDHVVARGCGNRHCVNPNHLEPTTQRENVARGKTHTNRKNKLPLGVSRAGSKYLARKRFNGKDRRLGLFDNPRSAAEAYKSATEVAYV